MNITKAYWILVAVLSLSAIIFPMDYFRSTFVSNEGEKQEVVEKA